MDLLHRSDTLIVAGDISDNSRSARLACLQPCPALEAASVCRTAKCRVLEETLTLLKTKFAEVGSRYPRCFSALPLNPRSQVFFTPGNHELWLNPADAWCAHCARRPTSPFDARLRRWARAVCFGVSQCRLARQAGPRALAAPFTRCRILARTLCSATVQYTAHDSTLAGPRRVRQARCPYALK